MVDELPWTSPFRDQTLTIHLTELMVIVAIMGIGLKINRPFGIKRFRAPMMLATVGMLVCIVLTSGLAYFWLGFGIASAMLVAAVLAPTDPVLAADVQIDEPHGQKDHEVKFTLTAEAGINDGLAFPFTWLAITLATSLPNNESWFFEWISFDVLYRIAAGVLLGWVVGKVITYLFFKLPDIHQIKDIQRGLISLSATLFVYGFAELLHGYGFIAVFVTAITIRNYEMEHEYHQTLHAFIDQIEHIFLASLLVILGGALTDGLLENFKPIHLFFALFFVLLIRPLIGWISLWGCPLQTKHKFIISFFGIKGIGSFFYLSFAMKEANFEGVSEIWTIVTCVILVSVVVHGLSATTVMKRLEK
jgi:NhaP-type Na+/H+ or K+/H+ antiporter